MIVKIAGAVLVVMSASGLGLCEAQKWKNRLRLMENLRRMIILLKGEILYANATLEEAFASVGQRGGGELGIFFKEVARRIGEQSGEVFFTLWKEAVSNLDKGLDLTGKDREQLKAFGEHLGYLDSDMQERTILLYLEQLDDTIAYLKAHVREKSRLYTSLGVMGGLFLMIILI